MQSLLQQFSLKDLLTYLLLGLSIWYNTQNNQAGKDSAQDLKIAVLENNQQQLIQSTGPALKETNQSIEQLRTQLAVLSEQLKNAKSKE